MKSVFCRDMRVAENTLRESERRIVRYKRTTEAQSEAKPSRRKSGFATFSTVSAPHSLSAALF